MIEDYKIGFKGDRKMDKRNEQENARCNQGRVSEHEHEHKHGHDHDHDHGKMPVVLYFVGLALALIALFFKQNETVQNVLFSLATIRSEERRVGKVCRTRRAERL